jgi:hypothetical protein
MNSAPEWFVYWAVAATDVPAASEALRRWHERLEGLHPGLHTSRFGRPDARPDRPDRHTLMETYRFDASLPEEAGARLAETLRNEGDTLSAPWRLGARHVEVFQRLP